MIAMVFASSPVVSGSLLNLMLIVTVVPIGLLLAPQPVRRDKRTLIALGVILLLLIGAPVYAVICNICEICNTCAWWWCPIECWFL